MFPVGVAFETGWAAMSHWRFEMHEYRHVIHGMPIGESDRATAKSRLMGRLKYAQVREVAECWGWPGSKRPVGILVRMTFPNVVMPPAGGENTSSLAPTPACLRVDGGFGSRLSGFQHAMCTRMSEAVCGTGENSYGIKPFLFGMFYIIAEIYQIWYKRIDIYIMVDISNLKLIDRQ